MEHQCEISHRQGYGNKNDSDEPTADVFHTSVVFAECRAPSGCISQLTEQIGQKAERNPYGKSDRPTEIMKSQRNDNRYEYHKQPAKEKQRTSVKVVMLPLAPFLCHIPYVVDEADPVYAIAFLHAVTAIQKTLSGRQVTPCQPTQFESCDVFRACSHRIATACRQTASGTPIFTQAIAPSAKRQAELRQTVARISGLPAPTRKNGQPCRSSPRIYR